MIGMTFGAYSSAYPFGSVMVCSVIINTALRVVAGAGACAWSCATPAVSTAPIAMPARRDSLFMMFPYPLHTRPSPSERVRNVFASAAKRVKAEYDNDCRHGTSGSGNGKKTNVGLFQSAMPADGMPRRPLSREDFGKSRFKGGYAKSN